MKKNQEILLVEDNPFDAELTIRAIKQYVSNLILSHVKDGEEALDFIHTRGKYFNKNLELPTLIFLDIKLPKLSGLEVLKEIKSNNKTKIIPTIILTSSDETSDIEECYYLGANSYFVKPLDFEQYNSTLGVAGKFWTKINQSF